MNFHINWAWILILFAMFGGFQFLNNLINFIKDIIFKKQDTKITTDLIAKYPEVDPIFLRKTPREQLADLNVENHDTNKRLDAQDLRIQAIEENQQKIIDILEELRKCG